MHLVLGGTGHVGSAVAETLLAAREPVTVLTRSREKAEAWKSRGADATALDVRDVAKLRAAIERSSHVYVLNPPGDPSGDVSEQEHETVRAIVAALRGCTNVEKIVASSTYGAQPGERIGDLATLFALEEGLKTLGVPCEIVRGAYYMSNWEMELASAKESGEIHSFFPLDFELPMVAPADLGREAATRMMAPPGPAFEIVHVEGPNRYTANDVADAFSRVLSKRVRAVHIRPSAWIETLMNVGFSGESASSFAGMFDATSRGAFPPLSTVRKTATSLDDYVRELVDRSNRVAA